MADAQAFMGQVRRDYLPSLRSFLTEERHANLPGLRPASGDNSK
jgi:hypothetical protein